MGAGPWLPVQLSWCIFQDLGNCELCRTHLYWWCISVVMVAAPRSCELYGCISVVMVTAPRSCELYLYGCISVVMVTAPRSCELDWCISSVAIVAAPGSCELDWCILVTIVCSPRKLWTWLMYFIGDGAAPKIQKGWQRFGWATFYHKSQRDA